MSDYECPYCKHETDHCDDDPMGDDESMEVECEKCERTFEITASMHVTYFARCADGRHHYVTSDEYPTYAFCQQCGDCEITKRPTAGH